jgi:hypothetical protein
MMRVGDRYVAAIVSDPQGTTFALDDGRMDP